MQHKYNIQTSCQMFIFMLVNKRTLDIMHELKEKDEKFMSMFKILKIYD